MSLTFERAITDKVVKWDALANSNALQGKIVVLENFLQEPSARRLVDSGVVAVVSPHETFSGRTDHGAWLEAMRCLYEYLKRGRSAAMAVAQINRGKEIPLLVCVY